MMCHVWNNSTNNNFRPEMNANIFKSLSMIFMAGLQVKGREQRGKE
jgi:hypothetical protein